MLRGQRTAITLGCILVIFLACCRARPEARTFEHESFSFTIPDGWQTMAEIWNRPASSDEDHYGLGVQRIVMIQYPPKKGQGKAFFAVASSQLADGQDLESLFEHAYQTASPEIENASTQPFKLGDLSGYEITYKRPWGEPWWQFRDIWLEKDGVIYVLSFHAPPSSFENYTDTFGKILESFQFKD
jgi:hypothetical protein